MVVIISVHRMLEHFQFYYTDVTLSLKEKQILFSLVCSVAVISLLAFIGKTF